MRGSKNLRNGNAMPEKERPKYRIPDVLSWESINYMHRIVGHTTAIANEIEAFGVNMIDAGRVSEILKKRKGISLWQLRDICDELMRINSEQCDIANDFERYLNGEVDRPEPSEKIPMKEVSMIFTLFDDESVKKKIAIMTKWDAMMDDERNPEGLLEQSEKMMQLGKRYKVSIAEIE